MYTDYFGLTEPPFSLTTDPRFLYWSKAHRKAKSYINCALLMGDSSVIVTGEIGSGKTTLVDHAISELDSSVVVAYIHQTLLSEIEFIQLVATKFGIDAFNSKKVELLDLINKYLTHQHKQGKRVLLIIDEAQNLNQKMLEDVRLLSGLEIHNKKVLNIILVGQPELNDTLDSAAMEQLLQRVRFRFHLTALKEDDVEPYITHRLEVAGLPNQSLFEKDAYSTIYRYTGGIPRLINVLCDMALISVYAEGLKTASNDIVKISIAELRWTPYSERKIHKAQTEYLPDFEIPKLPKNEHKIHKAQSEFSPNFGIPKLPENESKIHQEQPEYLPDIEIPEPPKKPPMLLLTMDGQYVADYPLDAPVIRLGRKSNNDIRIPGPEVSRFHAEITVQNSEVTIRDNDSANGILVNDKPVKEKKLNHGDIITIGSQQFTYQENE